MLPQQLPSSKAGLSAYIYTILYDDNSEGLSYTVVRLAYQFALFGHVDTASKLVSMLNEFNYYHVSMYTLEPMWLLWHAKGQWPIGEKDRVRDCILEDREWQIKLQKGKEGESESTNTTKLDAGSRVKDEDVSEENIAQKMEGRANMYARQWYWPGASTQSQSSGSTEGTDDELNKNPHTLADPTPEMARRAIIRILDAFNSKGMCGGLVSALDLRLRFPDLDDDDQDGSEATILSASLILERIARHLERRQAQDDLGQSPAIWNFLSTGGLVKALEIGEPDIEAFESQVLEAVDQRVYHGRQDPPALAGLDIKDTLLVMQHNTKANTDAREAYENWGYPISDTLFRDPAPPEDIAKLEERLGVQLPEDYIEFLRLSNGFGAMRGRIDNEPPLHSGKDVKCIPEDNPTRWGTRDTLDLVLELPLEPVWTLCGVSYDDWPKISWAIEIGAEGIHNTFLVPPSAVSEVREKVAAALGSEEIEERKKQALKNSVLDWAGSWERWEVLEWCTVHWTAGSGVEMRCYPSFTAYLKSMARDGARTTDEICVADEFFGYMLKAEEGSGEAV
jgi:hypothetical protein